jgi:hypothetical protein
MVSLEPVRAAVAVVVELFRRAHPPVDGVVNPQDHRRQERGQDAGGQDGNLDVVVAGGSGPEGQLADEQGNGEADPGQQGDARHVDPGEVVGQCGACGDMTVATCRSAGA